MKIFFLLLVCVLGCTALDQDDEQTIGDRHKITGRVIRPDTSMVPDHEWFGNTKVYTNTGHFGLLREDGSFSIHNLEWGSHVVFVMNPTYVYDAIRVDINSKGKIRARALNNIQPSKVDLVPYPLRLRSLGIMKFFQQREQWRITDILFNPMVLMTIFPLAFMLLMPKMNDPEARKEMEQFQMPKMETPELSEIMTNFFGGSSAAQQKIKAKANSKKRDR